MSAFDPKQTLKLIADLQRSRMPVQANTRV